VRSLGIDPKTNAASDVLEEVRGASLLRKSTLNEDQQASRQLASAKLFKLCASAAICKNMNIIQWLNTISRRTKIICMNGSGCPTKQHKHKNWARNQFAVFLIPYRVRAWPVRSRQPISKVPTRSGYRLRDLAHLLFLRHRG
jgi:hypothetical protein